MSYTKHEFKSGEKLYASELNEMDEQIFGNSKKLENVDVIVNTSFEVGEELLTEEGWNTDGWSGNYNGGFTHVTGNENALTYDVPTEANSYYLVEFSITNLSNMSPSDFYVSLGGSPTFETYTGTHAVRQISYALKAVDSTSGLVVTPRSGWNGSISNLSVKKIVSELSKLIDIVNETQNSIFETRVGNESQDNMYIGLKAGEHAYKGYGNVSIGNQSLEENPNGFWNTAIGYRAMRDNLYGSRNLAIGYIALEKNISGDRNVAMGSFALNANTHGSRNVAIGADSLQFNTTGNRNIGLGMSAGYGIETGTDNIAIGDSTMYNAKATKESIAMGFQSMYGGNPNRSVGIGHETLHKGPAYSVGIGWRAGKQSDDNFNIFIGAGADSTLPSASNSIGIGYNAVVEKSNQAVFGNENITETKVFGNLIVRGTDGVKRQIVFNEDGTCTWTAV